MTELYGRFDKNGVNGSTSEFVVIEIVEALIPLAGTPLIKVT